MIFGRQRWRAAGASVRVRWQLHELRQARPVGRLRPVAGGPGLVRLVDRPHRLLLQLQERRRLPATWRCSPPDNSR